MKPATRAPGAPRRSDLSRSGPWIAAVGLLGVLWLVISTVMYAPWWGVLTQVVVLGIFAAMLGRSAGTSPARSVWIPVYAFGAWMVINAVGVLAFGWRL